MCIRDRIQIDKLGICLDIAILAHGIGQSLDILAILRKKVCLLYTSDAADERSSVDLGGRRIIKKKKNNRK